MKTLDTRDLDKRLDELIALRDALTDAREQQSAANLADSRATPADITDADNELEAAISAFGDEEAKELAELEEAKDNISEWSDGETLIPERDWVDYVKELLEDVGDLPKDLPHYVVIDWEATADNIKADYVEVTIDGETYFARSC